MNISKLYDYYKTLANSTTTDGKSSKTTTSSTAKTDLNSDTTETTSIKRLIDQLDLSSSTSDSTSYLNYSASGRYQNMEALADYLNSDSDSSLSELFGTSDTDNSTESTSLADYLSDEDSTDQSGTESIDSLINQIVQETTTYNNYLISMALNRMSESKNKNSDDGATANNTSVESTKQNDKVASI